MAALVSGVLCATAVPSPVQQTAPQALAIETLHLFEFSAGLKPKTNAAPDLAKEGLNPFEFRAGLKPYAIDDKHSLGTS